MSAQPKYSSSASARLILPSKTLLRPHRDIWHYGARKPEVVTHGRRGRPSWQIPLFAPRAGYRAPGSAPIGLHYGAPSSAVAFTREIFLVNTSPWPGPLGVASIDLLFVGSGGGAQLGMDTTFTAPLPGGGGGGGSVNVFLGIPITPGVDYEVMMNIGPPISGEFRELNAPFTVFAQCFTGGQGGMPPFTTAGGSPSPSPIVIGGSGGGGGWSDIAGGAAGGLGDNGGGDGGPASNITGTTLFDALDNSTGGGGGASGAVGTAGAGTGAPGNGGSGIIPPDSSFGPWGLDIGEGGFFGGGGGGIDWIAFAPPFSGAQGIPGIGNGAANTGGGGTIALDGTPNSGFTGIAVIVYATP